MVIVPRGAGEEWTRTEDVSQSLRITVGAVMLVAMARAGYPPAYSASVIGAAAGGGSSVGVAVAADVFILTLDTTAAIAPADADGEPVGGQKIHSHFSTAPPRRTQSGYPSLYT